MIRLGQCFSGALDQITRSVFQTAVTADLNMRSALRFVASLGVAISVTQSASAIPTLQIEAQTIGPDPNVTLTIADGGPQDIDPLPGQVRYAGAVGNWAVDLSGFSLHSSFPALTLSADKIFSNLTAPPTFVPAPAGFLTIQFSDTGFGPSSAFSVSIAGNTDGSLNHFDSYADATDNLFGHGTGLTTLGPFDGLFTGAATGPGFGDASYSLTLLVDITIPPAKRTPRSTPL